MSSFHFLDQDAKFEIPEDFAPLVGHLEASSVEVLRTFFSLVFSSITGRNGAAAELQEGIASLCSQAGVPQRTLKSAFRTMSIIVQGSISKNSSADFLQEDMQNMGISEVAASVAAELYRLNFAALSQNLVAHTVSVFQLKDMEWRFGVTASSSEMEEVGSTFLQLKLVIDKGGKNENVYLELTLPQFYQFLHSMTQAKTAMDFLSS